MQARLGLLAFVTLVSVGCAHATNSPPARATSAAARPTTGAVFIGCGYLYVGNVGQVPFSALLRAQQAGAVKGQDHVLVLDGVLIEVTSTTAAEVGAPGARGAELLRRHQEWELAYTAQKNGWPAIRPDTHPMPLGLPNIEVAMWGYDVPRPFELFGQTVTRMAYVVAAIEDAVFVVAAPLRSDADVNPVARLTGRIMRSLKRLDRPLDVRELSDQVKATPGKWPDCAQPI